MTAAGWEEGDPDGRRDGVEGIPSVLLGEDGWRAPKAGPEGVQGCLRVGVGGEGLGFDGGTRLHTGPATAAPLRDCLAGVAGTGGEYAAGVLRGKKLKSSGMRIGM